MIRAMLAASIAACGTARQLHPDVTLSAPISVNAACVQTAIDSTTRLLAERMPELSASAQGATIDLVESGDIFMCDDAGQTRDNIAERRAIVVYRGGSLAETSLCHELFHVLLYSAGYQGEHHDAPGIFESKTDGKLDVSAFSSAEWACKGEVVACEQRIAP